MKAILYSVIGLFCLGSVITASADDASPRYKFIAGETNVFAVEITVRSETGLEVSTGNVFLVTKAVTTNSAKLVCCGTLNSEDKRTPSRDRRYYGGFNPRMVQNANVFPNDCEIELDEQGREIRDGGDYVLAAPLGKLVQSLFTPLSAKSSDEPSTIVTVLDDPFWFGPAESFLNARMNGRPIAFDYYMNGQRTVLPATFAAGCQTATSQKNSTADTVEFHRQLKLTSFSRIGEEPRLIASSKTDFVFDRKVSQLTTIETQAEVVAQTDVSLRHAKLTFKARRLTGAELAAASPPPPPEQQPQRPSPRKLAGADLEKLVADLKSSEVETRRAAIRQLQGGVEVASPSQELVELVAAQALDLDFSDRETAANFVGKYSTVKQTPVLVKLMKDSNSSIRRPALVALGRLKDERVIQPLIDFIVRYGNTSYGNGSGDDISSALINFGPGVEKAVLKLLHERNIGTLQQACNVLKHIGTVKSLGPLQELLGDSDEEVSQAAVDAVRAIKQRR